MSSSDIIRACFRARAMLAHLRDAKSAGKRAPTRFRHVQRLMDSMFWNPSTPTPSTPNFRCCDPDSDKSASKSEVFIISDSDPESMSSQGSFNVLAVPKTSHLRCLVTSRAPQCRMVRLMCWLCLVPRLRLLLPIGLGPSSLMLHPFLRSNLAQASRTFRRPLAIRKLVPASRCASRSLRVRRQV